VFTKSRGVLLQNLTPGKTYTVQARSVGGKTGYSDWSDPASYMSLENKNTPRLAMRGVLF
jgi:hypothetical protein